ncbi:MAG: lysophospholipid acyltransferase family protein [Thermoanaerobaculia bacterium]
MFPSIFREVFRDFIYPFFKEKEEIFPEKGLKEKLKILIKCSAHFGRVAFEYLKFSGKSPEFLEKNVKIEGIENLREAVLAGKGVFIISAHFGNWEVAALGLSKMGFPQGMVHRPLDNPYLEKHLSLRRTRYGNWLIPKKGALKGILKNLREGKIVDILIDQKSSPEQSFKVKFLGQETYVISSPAKIVKITGAAVVLLFSYPVGKGYRISIKKPIFYNGEGEKELTQKYADILTEEILKNPHLWLLHHNRFDKV